MNSRRRCSAFLAAACCAAIRSRALRDLTLTTNGSLLAAQASALAAAGLQRVTVSLDSLDDAVFAAMNDVGMPVSRVYRSEPEPGPASPPSPADHDKEKDANLRSEPA